ncbi:hypothetical protein F4804DRAFT_334822 [Jackrogersella minutella]|nr:hypothetical protein F4804DRAFT_334822 [Jackrogersella minutella]
MAPKKDSQGPSAKDQKFFSTIFKYLPHFVDLDWDSFSREMGLKDANIAKIRYRQIRLKYAIDKSVRTARKSSSRISKPRKQTRIKIINTGLKKKEEVRYEDHENYHEERAVKEEYREESTMDSVQRYEKSDDDY